MPKCSPRITLDCLYIVTEKGMSVAFQWQHFCALEVALHNWCEFVLRLSIEDASIRLNNTSKELHLEDPKRMVKAQNEVGFDLYQKRVSFHLTLTKEEGSFWKWLSIDITPL